MKILIIGAGFLGKEVARSLVSKATLSVTSQTHALDIKGAKFTFLRPSLFRKIPKLVVTHDVIIVTSSAKGGDYLTSYLVLARELKKALYGLKHKTLIYTSSTGVYKEAFGHEVTEHSSLDESRSKILIETEKTYLSLKKTRVVILRLSGLYGESRPLKNLYEKYKTLPISEKLVNFVTVTQAAYAICYSVFHPIHGIYNCSSFCMKNTEIIKKLFQIEPVKESVETNSPHGGSKHVVSNKLLNEPGFNWPNSNLY